MMPVRTCLGCGVKTEKNKLLRFAVDDSSQVIVDPQNKQGGRGVYCCMNDTCLQKLLKNRTKLSWAFRVDEIKISGSVAEVFSGVSNG